MVKAEKAQELTKKLKRMGEENQVEDEIEKADRMAGLGFKMNPRLFDKMESRLVDPNKNFYQLQGENTDELERLRVQKKTAKLSKRISKAKPAASEKLRFVGRKKGERGTRRAKIPRGKKMN